MANIKEERETLERLLAQLYTPIRGRKRTLSAKKYNEIYEQYEEIDKHYELDGEERPGYGLDDFNDLLDDVCAGLA